MSRLKPTKPAESASDPRDEWSDPYIELEIGQDRIRGGREKASTAPAEFRRSPTSQFSLFTFF